jgi:hypothetical protein
MMILRRILLPVSLRQQQPGIFERTHHSLSAVYRGVLLNICSKLVRNSTFFQNNSVVLLDFQT